MGTPDIEGLKIRLGAKEDITLSRDEFMHLVDNYIPQQCITVDCPKCGNTFDEEIFS